MAASPWQSSLVGRGDLLVSDKCRPGCGVGVSIEQSGDRARRDGVTQDLAAALNQVLNDSSANYVYGHERLVTQQGATRTWYATDALGSVRMTLDDTGAALGSVGYDP
ncbi:MAG: hypothetical protein MI924_17200 [Chloroflexales bacterium]|nr:hypothetical protein [Chloroflexales bacterium]